MKKLLFASLLLIANVAFGETEAPRITPPSGGSVDTTSAHFSQYIDLEKIATPVAPAAIDLRFYAKTDDRLYVQNSAGIESELITGRPLTDDAVIAIMRNYNGDAILRFPTNGDTSGNTVLEVPPKDAYGSWWLSHYQGTNGFGETRSNNIFTQGYNLGLNAQVIQSGIGAAGSVIESFWAADETIRRIEYHPVTFRKINDLEVRSFSWEFDLTGPDVDTAAGSMGFRKFDFQNTALNNQYLSIVPSASANGGAEFRYSYATQLNHYTNNVLWLQQNNAAATAMISMMYVDSDDEVRIAAGGQQVKSLGDITIQNGAAADRIVLDKDGSISVDPSGGNNATIEGGTISLTRLGGNLAKIQNAASGADKFRISTQADGGILLGGLIDTDHVNITGGTHASGAGNLLIYNQNLTTGTMTYSVASDVIKTTHKFAWTNAMVVALGAVTSGDVTVGTLPAKTVVTNAYIVITGTGVSAGTFSVSLGRTSATYIDYIVSSDAEAAANTVYGDASGERGTNLTGYDLPSYTATTAVKVQFNSTVTNLDGITGSTGVVYLETMTVP